MNKTASSRGIWEWQIVILIMSVTTFIFVLFFIIDGMTEEAVRKCIRSSARFSVISFCLAFGAAALHYFGQNSLTWWVKMNRRYFGLTFAYLHLIHLVFLAMLQMGFHPVFERAASTALTAGGIAYLFIILMMITSFQPFKHWLTANSWSLLHTVGGWWIWGVYMSSNWKNVFRGNYGYLFVAILLLAVGVGRIVFYLRRNRL